MSIAANKVKNIRCALCYNEETAKSAKEHNDANIMTLGADFVTVDEAVNMIKIWRSAKFLGGIYKERLDIVEKYEQ